MCNGNNIPTMRIGDSIMLKRITSIIIVAVFILSLPIMLLFTDVQIVAFDRDYYRKEFIKYEIPQQLKMELSELIKANENSVRYLEGKRDNLDFKAVISGQEEEFFSPKDKLHMIDVRNLFIKGRLIRDISLVYIMAFIGYFILLRKSEGKRLAKYFLVSSSLALALIVVLVVLMYSDFYKYFTIFHQIFFTNDLWLLDPMENRLVNIYPEAFFTDIAFSISKYFIAELITLLGASSYFLIKLRR